MLSIEAFFLIAMYVVSHAVLWYPFFFVGARHSDQVLLTMAYGLLLEITVRCLRDPKYLAMKIDLP